MYNGDRLIWATLYERAVALLHIRHIDISEWT